MSILQYNNNYSRWNIEKYENFKVNNIVNNIVKIKLEDFEKITLKKK